MHRIRKLGSLLACFAATLLIMASASTCNGKSGGPTDTGGQPMVPAPPAVNVSVGTATGGDVLARQRIEAQIPTEPGTSAIDSLPSVKSYVLRLVGVDPEVRYAFDVVDFLNSCAYQYGVYAARAYVDNNLQFAGAVVVISQAQFQQLYRDVFQCLSSKLKVPFVGGGPTSGGFSPCIVRLSYEATTGGVPDVYWVFVAGTSSNECDTLANFYKNNKGAQTF